MEKQRNYKNFRFIRRLLILLISLFPELLTAAPKNLAARFKSLEFVPIEDQDFTVGQDIKYQLNIPEITPLSVEVKTPPHEDDIIFKTFRRTGNNNGGTKLEIWYEFEKPGEVAPSPLEVNISGTIVFIPFAKVFINEDRLSKLPQVVVKFPNKKAVTENSSVSLFNLPASEKIRFTVSVQNTKAVLGSDYQIPKDSLFTIVRDINLNDRNPSYEFEWTPLKKGKTPLPRIKFTVTAFDGSKHDIYSPDAFVTITNSISKKTNQKSDRFFNDAFAELEQQDDSEEETDSLELILKKVHARRALYLKLLFISLAAIILAAIVLFLLKIKSPSPYLLLSVLLVLSMTIFTGLSKKKTAVYTTGTVKSIPELKSGKTIQIQENSEVKILKDVHGWYCIQSGSITGWTLKENVRIY